MPDNNSKPRNASSNPPAGAVDRRGAGGARPRIVLLTTGGTIATVHDPSGLNVVRLSGEDLLGMLPERLDLVTSDPIRAPSHALTLEHSSRLAHEVDRIRTSGYDGVVITHGTDTMEESAYLLALQLKPSIPIVLTGAMRPFGVPGSDAAGNLISATRVAETRAIAALGPVVAIQDEVHLARWVTKSHTTRVAAFASPDHGPVGFISEGRVHIDTRPRVGDFLGLPDQLGARVELVWAALGMHGRLATVAAEEADGIVVAGTGAGHVPLALLEPLMGAIERGIPVVLASRVGSGAVMTSTYGGPGSETELLRLGFISAGSLPPLKARLRLLVALELGLEPRRAFQEQLNAGK